MLLFVLVIYPISIWSGEGKFPRISSHFYLFFFYFFLLFPHISCNPKNEFNKSNSTTLQLSCYEVDLLQTTEINKSFYTTSGCFSKHRLSSFLLSLVLCHIFRFVNNFVFKRNWNLWISIYIDTYFIKKQHKLWDKSYAHLNYFVFFFSTKRIFILFTTITNTSTYRFFVSFLFACFLNLDWL